MTTKRKPTQRKSKRRKKSRTKRSRAWVWVVFFVPLVLAGFVAYKQRHLFFPATAVAPSEAALLEGILVAGGVDLDRDLQKVVNQEDGIERWKVGMTNRATKNRLMRGMRQVITATAGTWQATEEARKDGNLVHLVDVELPQGAKVRLLFVVPEEAKKPRRKLPKKAPRVSQARQVDAPEPKQVKENPVKAQPFDQPTIAIILDDIGQRDVSLLKPLLDLKYPITFAIIPFLPHSRDNAIYLHRHKYEVMLHMPMEPDGYPKNNPGKGAVFAHFTAPEIKSAVTQAIEDVPFIKGVNNHMGSRITASRALMTPILESVKGSGLYYIDSRTNSNTVAHRLALTMGLRSAKRDVFLDSVDTYSFSVKQLSAACKVADTQGSAVVIGHPYPTTISALVDELPKMDRKGYRFVFASTLVDALGQL